MRKAAIKTNKKRYKGVVALTTMLVVMAVLTASGIALVYTSINLRNSTQAYYHSKLASVYMSNCLEESVDRLKYDQAFTGTFNFSQNGENCDVTVSNDPQPDVKVIDITSISDSYQVDKQFRLDISDYPYLLL